MTYVVGVAGGTGSGKTTIAEQIAEALQPNVQVLHHDNYYADRPDLTYDGNRVCNVFEPRFLGPETLASLTHTSVAVNSALNKAEAFVLANREALLPQLGGVPSAWTACLLFFQAALLLGYGYAHAVVGRLQPAHQAGLHVLLLVAA